MTFAWRTALLTIAGILLAIRVSSIAVLNAGAVVVERNVLPNWHRGPAARYGIPATHVETAAASLIDLAGGLGAHSARVSGFNDLLQGRDSDAAAAFDASAEPIGLFWSGNILMRRGDRAGALQRWIRATPAPTLRIQLAKSLFDQANDGVQRDDRIDDAAQIATSVIGISRGRQRLDALWLAVNSFQAERKTAEAARLLSGPNADRDPRLLALRAFGAFAAGDAASALASANRSLAIGDVWMARYVRGLAALRQCRTDDARRDFEMGLALPSDGDYRQSWLHLALGSVHWIRGEHDGAIREWQTYSRLQPSDPAVAKLLQQARGGTLVLDCRTIQ